MVSINQRAYRIVQGMVADADGLQVAVHELDNGTTMIDCGIDVPGSLQAGRMFAEVCLGGLGRVDTCQLEFGSVWLPAVSVTVDNPVLACMASQYAGWPVKQGLFFAMGSGPARVLYAKEPLFAEIDYRDRSEVAVLALEGRQIPSPQVADAIAANCNVAPEQLALLIAPTASLVGSVQVAARVVETGMHKMHEVGFDIRVVQAGFGTCPLAPIAKDDLEAIGRTNDGVLYGGRACYTVSTDDVLIEQVMAKLPSSASHDYGTPFAELFKRYHGDFYQIDPLLFSPAEVCINNRASGRTFTAGRVNGELIERVLLA